MVSIVVAGVSCSPSATRSAHGTSTSNFDIRTEEPLVSTEATGAIDSAQQERCLQFAPSDEPVFLYAETLSVADIRRIVVVTAVTDVRLPDHDATEQVLWCSTTSPDGTRVAQFWVTSTNESEVLCNAGVLSSITPAQRDYFFCQ